MTCANHPDVEQNVHPCSRCNEPFCPDCLVTMQGRPFCAACKTEHLLDVQAGVDRQRMTYAGFWMRFGAQVLDTLIWGVPAYAIFVAVMMYVSQNPARVAPWIILVAYVPLYVCPILYEALMLSLKNGQTIGKLALRIRVVRPDGSPITPAHAWGRAAIRLVLSCLVIVDFLSMFFTDEKTTLHDMVAGTRVVVSG